MIRVAVWFGFNKRKRLIRVFGLRAGSVRRPVLNSFRTNFIEIFFLSLILSTSPVSIHGVLQTGFQISRQTNVLFLLN